MRTWILALVALGVPLALRAQSVPGSRLELDVAVVAASVHGDTTTLSYRVTNRATSAEQLLAFTVDAPAGTLSISRPEPADDWVVLGHYRGRPVVEWWVLGDEMQPGQASPVLTFSARGVAGLVTAWARGNAPPPPLPAADTSLPDPGPVDRLATASVRQLTVGIVPLPADLTPAGLVTRLQALLGRSCGELGWIPQQDICTSLSQKLGAASASLARGRTGAARDQLEAFLAEVAAQAQPPAGKHLDSRAAALLSANAAFLLGRM